MDGSLCYLISYKLVSDERFFAGIGPALEMRIATLRQLEMLIGSVVEDHVEMIVCSKGA